MTTVERRTIIQTRVEGGTGWVTPDHSCRADLHEIQLDALRAVADHIDNPAVSTIVIADFPAAVLNATPSTAQGSDAVLLMDKCRQVSERLWSSSKTLIVRRQSAHHAAFDGSERPVYIEPLTERERQVLSLASQGISARAIGAKLFISERTVESHVSNGYRKLGIRSRIELVRRAPELGL
ncbi:response regulator transcription factor [Mycolicibacterium sp. XJ1819]